MLITESQMGFARGNNSLALLDKMSYLTEAESVYAPAMVPIVENSRMGARLVDLEDLTTFAEANGIEDLGYALTLVCEASEIDPSTVAFTVDKVSIIEDASIADLASNLLSQGVNVVAKPLSPNSRAAIIGEACLDYALGMDDWSLMEAFINDDFDLILESENKRWNEYRAKVVNAMRSRGDDRSDKDIWEEVKGLGQKELKARLHYGKEDEDEQRLALRRIAAASSSASRKQSEAAWKERMEDNAREDSEPEEQTTPETKKTVETNIQSSIKEWKSKPRKWFAEKIAWLHDKAQEFNEKLHKDGKNAPWYKKVLGYITKAIAFLTRKMHNLFAEKGKEIGDSKNGNFSYSSFHKAK